MIGYWKGGRTPLTTTGNNFMENFVFLTPRFKGLLWFLLIGIPMALIMDVINPTSTYEFKDYHHDLKIKYQISGDEVTGNIEYHWDEYDTNYHLVSDFTGKVNGSDLIIELEDNNIRTYVGPKGRVNKNMVININNDQIYFQGLTAKKI